MRIYIEAPITLLRDRFLQYVNDKCCYIINAVKCGLWISVRQRKADIHDFVDPKLNTKIGLLNISSKAL